MNTFDKDAPLLLVGIDEVGRGCIAGPISACAYAFYVHDTVVAKLRDSKKLSPMQRAKLVPVLEAHGMFGHGSASSSEIDDMGIVRANHLAMERALEALSTQHAFSYSSMHVIVDGNQLPTFSAQGLGRVECMVKADDLVPVVSAASVLAKEKRDSWMRAQAVSFPAYGFDSHSGYPSASHLQAIAEHGACDLHRMTFGPLKARPGARLSP